ncbi:short-chain dehydrogenase [Lysinibacillus sp. BW-2-10]|uniref:short-chain dehydrogenase n=1 Tax=Lysinibacillus sp. BW-2-10 TaxID=2590030 RepID=UPI00117FED13|nr:short-chain dehydrogenase [Lysinibacillus sp. BW-2-10]TSI04189.1 short-chain dehydrogenase [Lysinibacillus sp. BW-2-10]
MFGIWTIPALIAGTLIVFISAYLTWGVMKKVEKRDAVTDTPINKVIREHPIVLNPIIIPYIIFIVFTGIIVFYYWAKYGY